jgi:hypothetical protein
MPFHAKETALIGDPLFSHPGTLRVECDCASVRNLHGLLSHVATVTNDVPYGQSGTIRLYLL